MTRIKYDFKYLDDDSKENILRTLKEIRIQ